jgi:general L-amino acid transport system substrate-binding protein
MALLMAFSAALFAPHPVVAQEGGLLAKVKARGKLICGVQGSLQGFGIGDPKTNTYTGFDVDFCRVVAATVLGDATKVDFKPIASADRFIVIASGEVDVLFRNTTYTAERDVKLGTDFGPTIFYDGQTIMARAADKMSKLEELKGATICAVKGTTNEQNIIETMRAINVAFKLVTFERVEQLTDAFVTNRCDALTSDRVQLVSVRASTPAGKDWVLFDVNFSKEPLGPVYKQGDAQWGDVIRWSVYATIIAEELGITSKNVDEMVANSKHPEARRLLGVDGELYKSFGFEKEWALNAIKQVGNYGEIFDRNLGPETPFNLKRGLNDLWTRGGLLYAPPYR